MDRTLACEAENPGSTPGERTIKNHESGFFAFARSRTGKGENRSFHMWRKGWENPKVFTGEVKRRREISLRAHKKSLR